MKASLKAQEQRLAYLMLLPPLLIVAAVVIFPVVANFWISFKPVGLADLRTPTPSVREPGNLDPAAGTVEVRYRLANRSGKLVIGDVVLRDTLAPGLTAPADTGPCAVAEEDLTCRWDDWAPRYSERLTLVFAAQPAFFEAGIDLEESEPEMTGNAENPMLSGGFTLDNYRRVLAQRDFVQVLGVTVVYTVFGTLGALILGLFAALLLNQEFRGRTLLRGLFLFPYVSPVIAVAFTWVFFLDPFSGVLNALGIHYGITETPLNFLGTESLTIDLFGLEFGFPLALATVIAFEAWRYFPLAFLFILARLQALPSDLYEAASMDGATPLQKFRFITLPQLVGILSILFMLRFIWTFNKFDDIFLMTGGAAGTRTLTVNVYEQGFALLNLGAGAAAAVITFGMLAVFMVLYFIGMPKEEVS
ncbi:MAG: sugar ABC transporter permease [Inquilinus sp.]|nr:sugar ABC transporter permease [Inquilinus sp.]